MEQSKHTVPHNGERPDNRLPVHNLQQQQPSTHKQEAFPDSGLNHMLQEPGPSDAKPKASNCPIPLEGHRADNPEFIAAWASYHASVVLATPSRNPAAGATATGQVTAGQASPSVESLKEAHSQEVMRAYFQYFVNYFNDKPEEVKKTLEEGENSSSIPPFRKTPFFYSLMFVPFLGLNFKK